MKQKTAMHQLIEELKITRKKCLPQFRDGIDHAILRASAFLELEKQTIIDDADKGREYEGYLKWTYKDGK